MCHINHSKVSRTDIGHADLSFGPTSPFSAFNSASCSVSVWRMTPIGSACSKRLLPGTNGRTRFRTTRVVIHAWHIISRLPGALAKLVGWMLHLYTRYLVLQKLNDKPIGNFAASGLQLLQHGDLRRSQAERPTNLQRTAEHFQS